MAAACLVSRVCIVINQHVSMDKPRAVTRMNRKRFSNLSTLLFTANQNNSFTPHFSHLI